jgi:hypothetical protein
MNKVMSVGFLLVLAAIMTGCSWQGTSYDRGGNQHFGSPADWNTGNGKPDTGVVPAPDASPAAAK